MKLEEFRPILSEVSLRPILLLVGPEPYLKKRVIDALKKRGAAEHGEGFVCHTFYAASHGAWAVLGECRSGEFFVTAKLVVLHDVDRYRKDDLDALAGYVRSPDSVASLVMVGQSVDGRTAFAKAVGKVKGARIDLKQMYENEMGPWVEALARQRGKRVSRGARESLVELCGTNLTALAAEVEKLELFVGEREQVEDADVAAVVGSSRTETYYRLRDAVLERRAGDALAIWGMLVEEGESVYGLFGRLRVTLRELVNAKELAESGSGLREVGQALGIPSWRQRALAGVLSTARLDQLRRSLVLLFDADVDLRQSRLTDRQVAERLLVRLCAA